MWALACEVCAAQRTRPVAARGYVKLLQRILRNQADSPPRGATPTNLTQSSGLTP